MKATEKSQQDSNSNAGGISERHNVNAFQWIALAKLGQVLSYRKHEYMHQLYKAQGQFFTINFCGIFSFPNNCL